ncbi:U4/U6 small nuclear ribonuclear protein [Perkinsela sp. CCAP 1560/4]|nr:U4/U6 small nuclear ribonuclear protein [Perkinsela sp. CCAP 1560/4]|eukprot:KNH06341.1 U4/U6 small nuclear ribonuclear protein [Perkinsela sp. CCAP 1560/4]
MPRATAVCRRPFATKAELAAKHRKPYPNLPWLTAHHASFMDHAEHIYGRRETWNSMMHNAESQTQHYPITLLLEGCLKLERKIRQTARRNRQFAFRAREADGCMEKWMQEIISKGAGCLENFQTPQRGPNEKFTKPVKKAISSSTDASKQPTEADEGTPRGPAENLNELPFLRQRAAEAPSTLDPALSQWPRKHADRTPEVIEVIPAAADHATADTPVTPTSEPSEPLGLKELEKRKPARTMKEFLRQRPIFDAQHVFEKHRGETYTKVDWETLRGANPMKGYDGKRAIERKVRIRRGEDV